MSGTRVLDELLCFLGDVIFQVPVRTFMDNKCFIFDPNIPITDEHNTIHAEYKQLIDTLLESYCEDNDITISDVLSGIKRMSDMPDIREVFYIVFEQVWAANDFNIFVQVMCKRNLAIQELALRLYIQATGVVPDAFKEDEEPARASQHRSDGTVMTTEKDEDEELLRRVLEESKRDEERSKMKRLQQEDVDIQKTIQLSKAETVQKREGQQSLENNMQKLLISQPLPPMPGATKPTPAPSFKSSAKPMTQPVARAAPKSKVDGFGITPKGGPSGAEAANSWLQSAMAEAATSDTHKAVMAQMEQMSQDELKRRQEYLNEQREKLLKMKQQEREKQLTTAVKANPGRPQSARTARAALANKGNAPTSHVSSEEEQRRIAMRRAIADKLRMEVIGNQ